MMFSQVRSKCCAALIVTCSVLLGASHALATDREKAKQSVRDKFDVVIFGHDYSVSNIPEVIADVWFTGGEVTLAQISNDAKKLGFEVAKEMQKRGVDPTKEKLYAGVVYWSYPITKIPKLNGRGCTPYVAARKRHDRKLPDQEEPTGILSNVILWKDIGVSWRKVSDKGETSKIQVAGKNRFTGWHLDIKAEAQPSTFRGFTISRNIILWKENGVLWKFEKASGNEYLIRVAGHNKYTGWYLDIDAEAKPEQIADGLPVCRNVILTEGTGVHWRIVERGDGYLKIQVARKGNVFNGWYLDIETSYPAD